MSGQQSAARARPSVGRLIRAPVAFAVLILAGAVRFIHFALFEGTLLSLHYYLIDAVVILIIGSLGFRYNRARQMTTQYRWLYERTGPFSWRERAGAPQA